MTSSTELDRKLQQRLLLARRVEGDRLVLGDAVLLAALDGSRPLTTNERDALEASPLTARRLWHLGMERRSARAAATPGAANDATWHGSAGMLRAASSGGALTELATDDGYWTLHFVGDGAASNVILQLAAAAPFAARLLREGPLLRVLDGAGATILQGRLDGDGECEAAWPFAAAPAAHLQQFGAAFSVEPVAGP